MEILSNYLNPGIRRLWPLAVLLILARAAHSSERSEDPLEEGCPIGFFACSKNQSICIHQTEICNGISNCGSADNSDEENCRNEHDSKFWDTMFQKRPGADEESNGTCKYYDASSSFSSSSEEESFSSLEPQKHMTWEDCDCIWDKLFCHNLQLVDIPRFPKDTTFLDLTGSQVDSLGDFEHKVGGLAHLQTLILSSCTFGRGFAEFPRVFSKLGSLETLHLKGNGLRELPVHVFAGNPKLTKLLLSYNLFANLQTGLFGALNLLEELDLRNNKLNNGLELGVFSSLKSLKTLFLSENEFTRINGDLFQGLGNLQTLSLASNAIESIGRKSFVHIPRLKYLFLSWNKLKAIQDYEFCNLRSLQSLQLNGNELQELSPQSFTCLDSLESLNLEKNRFGELKNEPKLLFAKLTRLEHIYFDEFWMCWWAPQVRICEPKGDGISSVENLLDNILLRTCVWIMALLAIFGNLFVIVSRMVLREPNPVHSFYIKNLAFADLLMGIFLLSIAIADISFRGVYLTKQHAWRHSLTWLLSTLSSEASVLILTLITLDRYLSIIRPFAERSTRLLPAILLVSLLWMASFLLSYLPLSSLFGTYFGTDFYTTNALCLPLQLHNPYDQAWEYSFFLFILVNSIAFTFICYSYWKMLSIIKGSRLMIRSNQQKQDSVLTMRFGLVVLTDFLCWFPVILAKSMAMSGVKIPNNIYAWLAVFVLPVNSAINPIIYTLTTKLFKQQLTKLTSGFRKRMQVRRGVNLDESAASASSFSFFNRNRTQRQTFTTTNSMHNTSIRTTHKTVRGNGHPSHQNIQMTTFGTNINNTSPQI